MIEKLNAPDKLKNFLNHICDRFNLNQNYKILVRVKSVDGSILSKMNPEFQKYFYLVTIHLMM